MAVVCIAVSSNTFSQFDTRFWMPPIWNDGNGNNNAPSELFITTPFPDDVNVHVETPDGSTFVFDGVVSSGNPLQVALTPTLGQTNAPNVVTSSRGLIVTSSQPIQCVHKISGVTNQTLVTLKGKNGRGQDFYCGSQVHNMNANYGPNEYHFITVMAMENNTSITIDTPFDMFLAGPGDLPNPYNITLNQYESILIRGNNPIQHVAGSHVTSDKEIIVNSGSTHTRIQGGNAADGTTDQLVPVDLMGLEFALVKGDNDNPFDYAIVVATEDDTDVFIDGSGTAAANINAGEFYDFTLSGGVGAGHYIRTDKIAYVYHFTGASQDDEVGMSAIPQLDCTGSRYIEFSKFQVNTVNQIMNVLAPPEALSTLLFNGALYNTVPGVIVNTIPGLTGWRAIAFPNSTLQNDNVLTSDGFFHAGFLTGNGGSAGTYGFLSGFNDAFDFEDPVTGLPTTIYQLATLCQGETIDHCIRVVSCADDHNIINVEGNEGTVVVTPPTSPFDTCFSYTAPFNFSGYDTITFTVENRFNFTGQLDIVILVLDPDTPISAGVSQELCSPTTSGTLTAVDPDPLVNGTWTVLQGGSTLADPNSSTTAVSNLALGPNTFLWTQDYGCEVNTSITQITVYDGTAPAANAGPDASLCSNNNQYTMQANNPGVSGTGTWEIVQGNATINNINSATASVTNLGIGVNVFEWNIDNGPCPGGATVDQMIITVYNQNAVAANAGPDQSFCSNTFSNATLAGSLPSVPSTGLWTVVSGTGTFANAAQRNTTVSGLSLGVNVFQWTINNGPCGSTNDTVSITLFNAAVAPAAAGPDVEYCSTTTTHVMAATPVIAPATGLWTLVSGAGVIASPNSPTSSISNLAIGDNVFRWTVSNGPCSGPANTDEITITIYNQNAPAANAGQDQEFCSDGFVSAQLAGSSVSYPTSGLWTVVAGSGTFSNANSPSSTVSGLSTGTNTFQWVVDNGPCGTTSDQITIILYDATVADADAGPDAEYCTPNTQHVMAANAVVFPASGMWTLVSGSGTINSPSSATTTVSNLGIGDNVFRWTLSNGVCSVSDSDDVTITIFNQNQAAANAGSDQEFCSALFVTTNLAGNNAPYPASGIWTVVSGTGSFGNANSPTTSVTGLSLGNNVFQWTIDNGPCGAPTSDTVTIVLFDENQDPADAGPNASFCSTASTYVMQATAAAAPAQGTWTLISGTGTINNINNPNSSISGLGIGENIFRWEIDNGACPGTPNFDLVSIFIYDENAPVADAGEDQSFCFNPASPLVAFMDASPAIFPGTGSWVIIQGSGLIADSNDPNTEISALGFGENIFEWTINNGPCPPSSSSAQVSIFVYNPSEAPANAGTDIEICSSQPDVILAANTPVYPSFGTWTVVTGTGTFSDVNDPSATVSGYGIGVNTYRWTIDNGPCNNDTNDLVTLTVFDVDAPVADAGPDQEICSDQTTVFLDGSNSVFPGVGTWTVISGSGVFADVNDDLSSVSGLSIGENVFQWTIDNGPCPSGITIDTVSIFVFDDDAPAANAGPDQQICTPTLSATLAANAPVYPATGQWNVVAGSGTFVDVSDPNSVVNGLSVGQNIFRWSITNAPCIPEVSTDQVIITVFNDASPAANAGPDKSFCTPISSTSLAGNAPIAPATGQWTLVSGTGIITNPSNPTSQVTGLTVGANIFQWTLSNGPCGAPTTDQTTVFIFDENQESADAGDDQILCTPTSDAVLSGNSLIFPATGLWELVSGSGSIANSAGPSTSVSGLAVGVNTFRWTVFNGPCSPATSEDTVDIIVYDTNAPAANAGPDQSICTPTTSVNMSANAAVSPGVGTWTLVSGTGTIVNANDPNTAITGMGVGANTFQWTINNGPCGSQTTTDQVTILVYSSQAPNANAGPDQNLCTPQISTFLQANNAVFPGTGQWVLVSGSGDIADDTNPNTEVTNLSIGVNVFEWTILNGPCANASTSSTVNITVFDGGAPQAEAGVLQELCSPLDQTILNANPAVDPGTGVWTVINGTGTFDDPTDPNTGVTDLSIGTNTFLWTLDYSTCGTQDDSVDIIVYDSTIDPAFAGDDQSFCAPTNSTNLNADGVVSPAIGTWSLISGSGDIDDVNDPNTAVTNLSVGENIFVWTIYNGNCLAIADRTDTVSVFIFDSVQLPANAGVNQNICTPQSTVTLAGNSVIFPATGEWTIISGSGSIVDPASPSSAVINLGVGETVLQWSISNGDCGVTTDLVSIFIYDQNNPASNAGPDQEFCTPTSSTFLQANNPTFPSIGTWTVLNGTGIFGNPNDPLTEVTGLSIGTNTFRWSLSNGPCGSPTNEVVTIFIYDENADDAAAGPDQELCSPDDTAVMAANESTEPGLGSWSLLQGSATFANINNPQTTVSNLGIGENILVWTIDNGPCANGITSDQVSIFVFDPSNASANAGPDQTLCSPTETSFFEATTPTFPATGTWTLVAGTGTITNPNNPTSEVTGLSVGQNTFRWTVYNGPCSQGETIDQVSIFVFDENAPDADAGPEQNICTPITSVTMAGSPLVFPATGLWEFVQGSGTIVNPGNPTTVVNNLAPGINILSWTVSNGPCANGVTSAQVTINLYDNDAPDAVAGNNQELCFPNTTTVMNANDATGASVGTWTLFSGSGDILNPNDPNTTFTNMGIGSNVFEWTIDNGVCGSSTDQVAILIFDPTAPPANAGPDQEYCTPVSMTTMNASAPTAPGYGTWALVSGTGTIAGANSTAASISGLTIGENVFSWTVYNGPCAATTVDLVSIFIFDENHPDAEAGDDQELCLPVDNTVLNATPAIFPAFGTWSVQQGSGTFSDINDPSASVTGLSAGVNAFVWTIDNTPCPLGVTSDVVFINVFQEDAPDAEAGENVSICTPAAATVLDALDPTPPQTGTWNLVSGSGTISDINDPNPVISGLEIGVNVFSWTIYNGPCENDGSTDTVAILVFDENAPDANAGEDQELCLPTNSTQMAAQSPIIPAVGTWTLIQGAGTVVSVNNPNSQVTGLGVGENIFQWTVDNGPCEDAITSDTVSIFVFDEDAPLANAGEDQEICSPLSTVVMSAAPPTSPQQGTWNLVSGSGTIGDINDPATVISGLQVGVNVFSWTIYNGPCQNAQSIDTVTILVYDQTAPAADAGEDQELCLPDDSAVLTALAPIVPAIGTWTVIQGTGSFADSNDPNTTVSGLSLGTNEFLWTVLNGPCEDPESSDSVIISVFEEDALPANAGNDIEICTPESCVTLQATAPADPAVGTWTIVSGNGTIDDVNNPNAEICGLIVGETILQWSVDNGPCANSESIDLMSIRIYDQNAPIADAGNDQEWCFPTTESEMTATTPLFPGTGVWTLVSGTGNFFDASDPNTTVTGLSVGINEFLWTVQNGPCNEPTTDSMSITIFDPTSANASAGPDQFFCTAIGGTELTGNTPLDPAVGTWSVISGNVNIIEPNNPLSAVDNFTLGENILIWQIYNGPCANGLTTDTLSIFVNDASVADANAGPDQLYCGPVSELQLQGSETVGNTATGVWTIIEGEGDFENFANEFTYVHDLPVGVHTYGWTVDNLECGISSDTVSIFIYDPEIELPYAGEGVEICQNEFEIFELNAVEPDFPAIGSWVILEGPVELAELSNPNSEVLSLGTVDVPLGSTTSVIAWSIDNGVCGTANDTIALVLTDCLTIEIPNAFSPNRDLINDNWVIPNIESYPNNKLKIFNRWGAMVYEASPYLNDWNGRSEHPSSIGNELPVSTYYYILELGDGSEPFSGYVYLKR